MQVLDANRCFEKQCPSALSLQLAAYYYSLQIYSLLTPCFKDKKHTLYQVRMEYQSCVWVEVLGGMHKMASDKFSNLTWVWMMLEMEVLHTRYFSLPKILCPTHIHGRWRLGAILAFLVGAFHSWGPDALPFQVRFRCFWTSWQSRCFESQCQSDQEWGPFSILCSIVCVCKREQEGDGCCAGTWVEVNVCLGYIWPMNAHCGSAITRMLPFPASLASPWRESLWVY